MPENVLKIKFGKEDLILSTGKIAKQAAGSVVVQYGETVVLVTACMAKKAKEGQSFFPLTVEYQEKAYSAGRIPGGFFKREGKPSENDILIARLIDRPIRPLFPKGMFNDVQVMAIVLSSDGQNDPDVLALIGASCALTISDIPFNGPLAACRVIRVEGQLVLNPTYAEIEKSDLEVVVVTNSKGVVMLESKGREVSEEAYLEAVKFGMENCKCILDLQEEFRRTCGKEKAKVELRLTDPALRQKVEGLARDKLKQAYQIAGKGDREDALNAVYKELDEKLTEGEEHTSSEIMACVEEIEQELVRRRILLENSRVDKRGFKEIRPITCEVSVLPRTHGSGLFTRGQTQSMVIATLGTGDDEQLIEALEGERYKNFMLHYNFPPFSVGETGPVRGPGRREIGHGALAEKALSVVMPGKDKFPYTVRLVSEILESNGSSSMATICAGTLSLMDAGVPIKDAVAGVALGLVKEGDKAAILTDITGLEDHYGDMDFKVAGTKSGIAAVQLDLKIDGISFELLKDCLYQSRDARYFILDKIKEVIPEPRKQLSAYAPRIDVLKINPEKIGELIGPGGKNVKKIIAQTGASIDIEDDGTVLVASNEAQKSEAAIRMIKAITDEVEVGKIYPARVKRVTNFGAFCEIAPGKEGLCHVSELSDKFVKNVEEVVKVGDEIKVKVVNVDELGRINLSRKQVLAEEKKQA